MRAGLPRARRAHGGRACPTHEPGRLSGGCAMGALVFNDPCLVAVWPGMGCVAEIAGAYLTQKLGARPFAEIGPAPYFDLRQAHVKEGLLLPAALPRSVFYG